MKIKSNVCRRLTTPSTAAKLKLVAPPLWSPGGRDQAVDPVNRNWFPMCIRSCLIGSCGMLLLAALAGDRPLQVALAAEDAAAAPARRDGRRRALATDDTLYLDKKITYWLAQAAAKNPAEPKARIVAALSRALESKVAAVRVTAVDALGSLGPDAQPAAVALVRRLDDQMWVATAAAEALSSLGRPAVPPLIEAFNQGSADVRMAICRVLGNIGPDAAAAIPVLEKALPAAPPSLQERIQLALSQIRAKPAAPAAAADGHAAASAAAGSRLLAPGPGHLAGRHTVAAVSRAKSRCRLHGFGTLARLVGQRAKTPLAHFRARQGLFFRRHRRRETLHHGRPARRGPAPFGHGRVAVRAGFRPGDAPRALGRPHRSGPG